MNGNDVENTIRVRVTGTNFSPHEGFYARRAGVSVSGPFVRTHGEPDFLLTELMRSGQPLDVVTTYSLDPSVQGLQNLTVAVHVGFDKKTVSVSGYCWDSADAPRRTVPVFVGSGFDLAITDLFVDPSSPGVIAKASNGTLLVRGTGPLGRSTELKWTVSVQGANISSADGPSVTLRTQLDGNCSSTGGNPNTAQCNVIVLLAQLAEKGGKLAYPLNDFYADSFRGFGFSSDGVKAHMNGIGGTDLTVTETTYENNALGIPVAVIPTLYVSNVVLTQAVNNFTLEPNANFLADLVLGKSTVLAVDVTADLFPSQTPAPTIAQEPVRIVIQTTDPSNTIRSFSRSTPLGEIATSSSEVASNAKTLTITSPVFRPMNPGTFQFQVQAQASLFGVTYTLPFARKPGDFQTPRTPQSVNNFRVKQTNSLSVVYVPLSYPTSSGVMTIDPNLYSEQMADTNTAIQGMFPIKDGGLFAHHYPPNEAILGSPSAPVPSPLPSCTGTCFQYDIGLSADIAAVERAGTKLDPLAKAFSGIVPEGYFDAHNFGKPALAAGWAPRPGKVALVETLLGRGSGRNVHEIGHALGLCHPDTEENCPPDETPVSGTQILPGVAAIPVLNRIDFMGFGGARPLTDVWISATSYQKLFSSFLTNPSDPPVIVVSGILLNNGTVRLGPVFYLQSGIAAPVDSTHGGLITARAADGSIVSQASFATTFTMEDDSGNIFQTSSFPFLVQLPVSNGPASVEITQNGNLLLSFDPNSQLLLDVLNSIPDSSFIRHPIKTRALLVSQARRIEGVTTACTRFKARDHERQSDCYRFATRLVLALRAYASRVLNDSTETTDPLQATRTEVLMALDRSALSLIPNLVVKALSRKVRIQVIPDTPGQGVLRVVSATAPKNGTVEIDRDMDSVTYVSSTSKVLPDQFSVTIESVEGDRVVKTVTVEPSRTRGDGDRDD